MKIGRGKGIERRQGLRRAIERAQSLCDAQLVEDGDQAAETGRREARAADRSPRRGGRAVVGVVNRHTRVRTGVEGHVGRLPLAGTLHAVLPARLAFVEALAAAAVAPARLADIGIAAEDQARAADGHDVGRRRRIAHGRKIARIDLGAVVAGGRQERDAVMARRSDEDLRIPRCLLAGAEVRCDVGLREGPTHRHYGDTRPVCRGTNRGHKVRQLLFVGTAVAIGLHQQDVGLWSDRVRPLDVQRLLHAPFARSGVGRQRRASGLVHLGERRMAAAAEGRQAEVA